MSLSLLFFLIKKVTKKSRRVEAELSALWNFPNTTRPSTLKILHGL